MTSNRDPIEDPYVLQRFVLAQRDTYDVALAELRRGRKRTHWMWFVLPQLAGLGSSELSQRYAICSLDEASAYLAHPLLGARLRECAEALLTVAGRSAEQIVGTVDAGKLRSSMTLFLRAAPDQGVFAAVLMRYFDGMADARTDELLGARRDPRSARAMTHRAAFSRECRTRSSTCRPSDPHGRPRRA